MPLQAGCGSLGQYLAAHLSPACTARQRDGEVGERNGDHLCMALAPRQHSGADCMAGGFIAPPPPPLPHPSLTLLTTAARNQLGTELSTAPETAGGGEWSPHHAGPPACWLKSQREGLDWVCAARGSPSPTSYSQFPAQQRAVARSCCSELSPACAARGTGARFRR